ncbi:MAG: DeoR/GlpR transcriptional regulator [Bacteroidales bacterium]|nr:DeoR/GlpR transcriptional regulator [Bacteroidales bacterium]
MVKKVRNNTVERRKSIINLLSEAGQVIVTDLSNRFKVSEVTIRNDLEQLEQKNLLIRARGGAMIVEPGVSFDKRISDKHKLNYKDKARIGRKTIELINENDTIILDSGTTTMEVARNLENIKELTVITNALNIVNQLINFQNINVIIPGGYLRKHSQSLVGPLAEKSFRNFYVDKVFMGVDGFDTSKGIYTPNIEEAHLNNIMIEIAKEVILVTDSSKFKRKSLTFICPVNKINKVVTDEGISPEDIRRLEDEGVEVIIA